MKARLYLVFFAAVAFGLPAKAQDGDVATPPPATGVAADAAPAAEPPSDSHTAAAEVFLEAMNMKEMTQETIDQMLEMQVQQQPQLEMFKDVMKGFLHKHLSYDSLKGEMIDLYKTEFTEEELKQLTDFYRTPLGKKAVQKLPILSAKGAQIGMQRVQANMGELQQAIMERTMQMQGDDLKPTE
ncbi:DUF2059 domain-containing protein [Novipirellula artificiosorum]|nr:DUF2059 domain-containing protein [Novipirellula artificiosorum]